MNKHTPGPWSIDDLTVYALNGNQNQGNRFWATVCRGRDDNHYRIEASEARANTNLISAAPDLLEALEELKCELILSDVDMDYIESHFRKALNKAHAAIARARGEA